MYKVFIVDDEPTIRMGLQKIVDWERCGCTVCGTAEDGLDGLNRIKEQKPDIIFTDIKMPEMDGLSMIRKIKKFLPNCKIIILSGHSDFDYEREAISLGAFDFLLKPSNVNVIQETLERAVLELRLAENAILNIHREELLDGIKLGNEQMVEKSLSKIAKIVSSDGFDLTNEIKEFFWNIILSINKIRALEMKSETGRAADGFENIDKSHNMVKECVDPNDLMDILNAACFRVADRVHKNIGLKVQKIIEYIDEHYAEQISLSDVAESIGISTYYVSRIFKQEMGKNFIDYLNIIRMEKAKVFLKKVRYKVYEVADLVGIQDAHYFSKIFKKYVGVTPGEYRDSVIRDK